MTRFWLLRGVPWTLPVVHKPLFMARPVAAYVRRRHPRCPQEARHRAHRCSLAVVAAAAAVVGLTHLHSTGGSVRG